MDKKWANKLMNGEVYANSIFNFRKTEDDFGRGDLFEGSIKTINKNEISNEDFFKGVSENFIDHIVGNVVYIDEFSQYLKVFSMYCLEKDAIIDEKILKFGDSCIIIKNKEEFFKRIGIALNCMRINIDAFNLGKVSYYDFEDETKYLNPLYKLRTLSWQNEFRIVFYPGAMLSVFDRSPIKINIGSIEDIAELKDSKTFIREYNRKEI